MLGIVLCNAHWGQRTILVHVLQDLNRNANNFLWNTVLPILLESGLDMILEPIKLIYHIKWCYKWNIICEYILLQMNVELVDKNIIHQTHKYFLDTRGSRLSSLLLSSLSNFTLLLDFEWLECWFKTYFVYYMFVIHILLDYVSLESVVIVYHVEPIQTYGLNKKYVSLFRCSHTKLKLL